MDGNKSARAKGVPRVSEKWGTFQVETDYADSGCGSPIYKGKLGLLDSSREWGGEEWTLGLRLGRTDKQGRMFYVPESEKEEGA